jgi:hypothetical protein
VSGARREVERGAAWFARVAAVARAGVFIFVAVGPMAIAREGGTV